MKQIQAESEVDFWRKIGSEVLLISFTAPWCMPCRALKPVLENLEKAFGRPAAIAEMNIDKHQKIANRLGIQSIPTIILFKKGREINRFIGLQREEFLFKAVESVLYAQQGVENHG